MTTKPPYGAHCNSCGECCRQCLCPLAELVIGPGPGPCPALQPTAEGFGCGLILNPERYAPVLTAMRGHAVMSAAAIVLTGAGLGCDALGEGENPPNRTAVEARMRLLAEMLRTRSIKALLVWGIRP